MSTNSDSNPAREAAPPGPLPTLLSAPRPKRITTASSKLLDSSNTAAPSLSSHKQAIEAHRQAEDSTAPARPETAPARPETATPISTVSDRVSTPPRSSSPATDFQDDHANDATSPTSDSDSDSDSEPVEVPSSKSYLLDISTQY